MKIEMRNILAMLFLLFIALVTNAEGEKKNGNIDLKISSNDSMHVVTATVTDAATKIPLNDVEVTFYIKRMFGLMNIGNATTDSTGIISTVFPIKMPGSDTLGNIIVLAKVEDNDVMNDTVFTTIAKSKFLFPASTPLEPAIKSAHAPLWLKITFWMLLGGVWGLFFYCLFLIVLINRNKNKPHAVIT
ncbi:MAG TPA: hypothetical protein VJY62_20925 [Bacteroidia bacterium]|nr:hypothetical protein [Bacteroidia bacterium]